MTVTSRLFQGLYQMVYECFNVVTLSTSLYNFIFWYRILILIWFAYFGVNNTLVFLNSLDSASDLSKQFVYIDLEYFWS